ncbi:uncharacterized protein LOC131598467 [Vicia villosa]|uniref:uncharacterized protein LOC131598467 n=1 Tax=Vicia villosa TaxID=3911 RepID=UPI00273C4E0D|nr:uncharacterized protein LOC131598467 [Vicia villosa]
MDNGIPRQSSIRYKLKNTICCFTGNIHHHDSSFEEGDRSYNKLHIPKTPISPTSSSSSPCSWFKKSPPSNVSDYSRVRGKSLRTRVGRKHGHHRQSHSADFSYDPLSYALNFENENAQDDIPIKDFSSRLPQSPPSSSSTTNYSDKLPKEIVGYS